MSNLPSKVSMVSLGVKDMARSVQFYAETLGLTIAGQPGVVTFVQAGDVMIVLNGPARSGVEVIFPSESVGATHAELESRGCPFVAAPHEVTPGLWAATFADPDGHNLTVLGPQ